MFRLWAADKKWTDLFIDTATVKLEFQGSKMDFSEIGGIDTDKYVIFKQDDLHSESFPLMKEIRRQGKLCDVTLKVRVVCFR